MKKRAILATMTALATATVIATGAYAATSATTTSSTTGMTQMAKVSYSMGYDIGHSFKQQKVNVDSKMFAKGMHTGLMGQKPMMSKTEMRSTMVAFQKQMMAKMIKKQESKAKDNASSSQAYLTKVSKMHGVKSIEKGLYYRVLKAGTGKMPSKTDTVVVNYRGSLIDGKVFDSSYKRGKPATFKVDQVIPGWTKALEKMKVGATWMLYISPKLAYGKFAPPVIGPNQTLIFKVNLISIKK